MAQQQQQQQQIQWTCARTVAEQTNLLRAVWTAHKFPLAVAAQSQLQSRQLGQPSWSKSCRPGKINILGQNTLTQLERESRPSQSIDASARRDATLACNVQRAACNVCSVPGLQLPLAACAWFTNSATFGKTHFYFGLVSKNYVKRFKAEHEQFVDSHAPQPLPPCQETGFETALAASATVAAAAAAHPLAVCNVCCVCFFILKFMRAFRGVCWFSNRAQVIPPSAPHLFPFAFLLLYSLSLLSPLPYPIADLCNSICSV